MKFSFNLWVLRYKRYNEVRLQRSNFAGPQHFVINVFCCIIISFWMGVKVAPSCKWPVYWGFIRCDINFVSLTCRPLSLETFKDKSLGIDCSIFFLVYLQNLPKCRVSNRLLRDSRMNYSLCPKENKLPYKIRKWMIHYLIRASGQNLALDIASTFHTGSRNSDQRHWCSRRHWECWHTLHLKHVTIIP